MVEICLCRFHGFGVKAALALCSNTLQNTVGDQLCDVVIKQRIASLRRQRLCHLMRNPLFRIANKRPIWLPIRKAQFQQLPELTVVLQVPAVADGPHGDRSARRHPFHRVPVVICRVLDAATW
ncbi:hypothetical protein D3C78_1326740 [compost metagenome]